MWLERLDEKMGDNLIPIKRKIDYVAGNDPTARPRREKDSITFRKPRPPFRIFSLAEVSVENFGGDYVELTLPRETSRGSGIESGITCFNDSVWRNL